MSKRFPKYNDSNNPSKKQRLDITKESNPLPSTSKERRVTVNNVSTLNNVSVQNNDDLWGDDFDDDMLDDLEEISSQVTASQQFASQSVIRLDREAISNLKNVNLPSTSHATQNHNNFSQRLQPHHANNFNNFGLQSQVLGSSGNHNNIMSQKITFHDFENNLNGSHNSTFRPDAMKKSIVVVNDEDEVQKWREEKNKLMEDFMVKEGESEYLRQKINRDKLRAEQEKKENERFHADLIKKHQSELNDMKKEKESLLTEMQLKVHETNKLLEKIKLLESGAVKLAQPQSLSIQIKEKNSFLNRNGCFKKVKTKEMSVQADKVMIEENFVKFKLKAVPPDQPLSQLPKCIFNMPKIEKPVVDMKLEEKVGKRNSAILQEEESFRIFENPKVCKPKVTIIDKKSLGVDFLYSEISTLMSMTRDEINLFKTAPIIHKVVATSRELILNSTIVLRNISKVMQNDDIRDMNELYLSNFYEMPVTHTKSLFASEPWYEQERGVESRRILAVMSYVAKESKYLANYISGKERLSYQSDKKYKDYIKKMASYKNWNKQNQGFEFLELLLEFVQTIGTIRRAHQFSGVIIAIVELIVNVEINVGFCSLGIQIIYQIVKEIILSRPLLICLISVSKAFSAFAKYPEFANYLCRNPRKAVVNLWKGNLCFLPDGCPLEIYLMQLDGFKLDPISIINLLHYLTIFSHTAFQNNSVPWILHDNYCNCCLNLLKFVIINLNDCSKVKVDNLKKRYGSEDVSWRITKREIDSYSSQEKNVWNNRLLSEDWVDFEENNKNYWEKLKLLQRSAISHGIRFLSFLAKRDNDFMIRSSDIDDAFNEFVYTLKSGIFDLQQTEKLALDKVEGVFIVFKNKLEDDNQPIVYKSDLSTFISLESWKDCIEHNDIHLADLFHGCI